MITSERQLKTTMNQLEMLRNSLEDLRKKDDSSILTKASISQVQVKIEDLQQEVDEYTKLWDEGLEAIELITPKDFLLLPIRYRIAKHLTKEAFAKEVDVPVRQISRYEASEYININGETLKQILEHIPLTFQTEMKEV